MEGRPAGQDFRPDGGCRPLRPAEHRRGLRAGTSKETELKLLDVAKGSLAELQGDYEAFLTDANETLWSKNDPRRKIVASMNLDEFQLTDDVLHDFSVYILEMRARFAPWLENEDSIVAANSLIVVIERTKALLAGQIERTMEAFFAEGGFRERMTRLRLEQRDVARQQEDSAPQPPACPLCGKPMVRRQARSGPDQGKPFWGCSAYPACKGTKAFP